ncbi:MAG: hypothetical protein CM15mP114_10790 [Alphaproteobacteria bacterium]|nr:MAG: hypothetical protein CM15mP114_10790 [Alphaproteobacteria bacterium]
MAKKTEKAKVTIDNKEYSVDSLSENAKAQLANIPIRRCSTSAT